MPYPLHACILYVWTPCYGVSIGLKNQDVNVPKYTDFATLIATIAINLLNLSATKSHTSVVTEVFAVDAVLFR